MTLAKHSRHQRCTSGNIEAERLFYQASMGNEHKTYLRQEEGRAPLQEEDSMNSDKQETSQGPPCYDLGRGELQG